jgi:hypothetical protein
MLALGCALVAVPATVRAEALFTHPSLLNRTPGPDFHVGTADDASTPGPLGPNASGANVRGAASYVLLESDGSIPTDGDDFDYVLFVDGTLDLELDAAASSPTTAVMTITGGTMQTTPEFTPGRVGGTLTSLAGRIDFGIGDASATAVLSGEFADPAFMTAIMSQMVTAAPGNAVVVMRPSFGSSGNAYLDDTITPLLPADAGMVALVEFTGTANGVVACCSNFGVRGVFVFVGTEGSPGGPTTTTTTIPGGGGCTTVAACGAALDGTLPPTGSTDAKVRRTANKLGKLAVSAKTKLAQAESASGKKRARLAKKTRRLLGSLLAKARTADEKDRLGVPLAPLEAAVNALLALVPTS